MNLKDGIIEYALNLAFVFGEFYILYNGKKYIGLLPAFAIISSRYLGKQINLLLQKDNSGGTTPYNPLKIPAKNITPANH